MSMLIAPQFISGRADRFAASGGSESTYTSSGVNYRSHTFTSSGTFAVTGEPGEIDIMTIGAGGGGAGGAY